MTTEEVTSVRGLINNSILNDEEKREYLGFVQQYVGKGRRRGNTAFLRVQKAIGQRAGVKIERNQNSKRLSSLSQRSARPNPEERDIVSALEQLVLLSQRQYANVVPLACLSLLLETETSSWPVLAVICCYSILWRSLPEDVKANRDQTHAQLSSTTLRRVKSSYKSLIDILPQGSERPAIIEPNSHRYLSHNTILAFVSDFNLPISRALAGKPVVALALPNGPLLGLACIAVASYYTAVPINASSGQDQFRLDIQLATPSVILVLEDDVKRLGLDAAWVVEAEIEIMIVKPKPNLTFTTSPWNRPFSLAEPSRNANSADDVSFILYTSGTSGRKKAVPITLHNLLSSVALVIQSWDLGSEDVCLNMMPLYHIGGLVRNLFAPILSGGSTILCPAFDPNLFWDIVEGGDPTWFNATPSMHLMILAEVGERMDALSRSDIRFVCCAAGGLLPSLATQLQETFGCAILPSYGMTECLPITAPPTNYALDRPGTSGISVGLDIAILNDKGVHQFPHTVGRIHVRGPPLFHGYLADGDGTARDSTISTVSNISEVSRLSDRAFAPFNRDGYFDTGDIGYLDSDGYLYVTGRNKELINRGGELISPYEVEDVIMASAHDPSSILHNRISEVLAFSVPHNILQEAVGIVLVTPPGMPRVDIRQLHEAIKWALHRSKWPVVILYMDALPKNNNNKVLRFKLGQRLGFDSMMVTDEMQLSQRHFEATCPPPETPLTESIPKQLCQIDCKALELALMKSSAKTQSVYTSLSTHDGLPAVVLAPNPKISMFKFDNVAKGRLFSELQAILDGYLIPTKIRVIDTPFILTSEGFVDIAKLQELLRTQRDSMAESLPRPKEQKLREMFASLLMCSVDDITSKSSFFKMGGDSFSAARLLSMLRKDMHVRLMINDLFQNSTIEELHNLIESMEESKDLPKLPPPGCTKTFSSTNPWLLIAQLLPMTVFHPLKRAVSWTLFLLYLAALLTSPSLSASTSGRYFAVLFSAAFTGLITVILSPFLAIAAKWILIGRYKEGIHPMFGWYHTRWWLVDKIMKISGKGIFNFSNSTRIAYYQLMGAKIGDGVYIDQEAVLGEYDLLQIGHGVHLEKCICRPFAVEHGPSMYLGQITLGDNSSIGLSSVVAPGTCLAEDTCIGPNSSSWEVKDATEANRELSPGKTPQPHISLQIFVGYPLLFNIHLISFLPSLLLLIAIAYLAPPKEPDTVAMAIKWFSSAETIGLILLIRSLDVFLRPIIYFFLVVLVKTTLNALYGPLRVGSVSGVEQIFRFRICSARHRDQIEKFRMWFMACLLPNGDISSLTELLGSHYEFTSKAARLLGAHVGNGVHWPAKGPSIQDYDLVEIGNGVTIGSRSHIVTSDGVGSKRVRIADGARIAERVVLSPGTTVGTNTVLGSGALTKRNTPYPPETVWIGSKAGGAVCLSINRLSTRARTSPFPELEKEASQQQPLTDFEIAGLGSKNDTANPTPFEKAVYEGQATYRVWGLSTIVFYSSFTNIFAAFYWTVPTVLALQYVGVAAQSSVYTDGKYAILRLFITYALFALVYAVAATILSIVALGSLIVTNGYLIGERKPGTYEWDKSSYCQRWRLFTTLTRLRKNCFGGIGILGMITGTHFLSKYFRALGAEIGKDCALYASGNPSVVLPEPDLVTIGDRVAIDDAELIAHIDSRGGFGLNPLVVGSGCVLRSGSKLLSGAQMGENSCLLEHTLVMAGDVVEVGSTYQGWPAEEFYHQRAADEVGAGELKL